MAAISYFTPLNGLDTPLRTEKSFQTCLRSGEEFAMMRERIGNRIMTHSVRSTLDLVLSRSCVPHFASTEISGELF